MKTFDVPARDEVTKEAQELFDQIQKRLGKVPNLYAVMGHSGLALKAFLQLEETLNGGVFNAKEREAIALAVSEINSCSYCLAAHTLAAVKRGFAKEETLLIRQGKATDAKLNATVQLAASIAKNRGNVDEEALESFYAVGYNDAALMELIGLVTVRIFTNYVYAITNIPVDFPLADAID